jgi:Putative DNA-binding domain
MLNPNADLGDLINEPRETLDVEVKDWLDLTDNDHRAMIAKEIIALANHGGGFLVIGFEEREDGTFQPSAGRPVNLDAWSQDNIQSIIAKYADPAVQCRVHHRDSAASLQKHPIIVVPGGHRVPIRAKAGAPDGKKLVAHRVYIRRPGPASEEPKTAEEWDRFLERCLQNRQAELLEAMRSIMAGVSPNTAPATPTRLDQLKAFGAQAVARWETLVAPLPVGVPPTLSCGCYDLLMAIDGDFERQSLSDLRDTIRQAVRNHSGWPPFVNLNRAPYTPKPVDGAIECWIGPDNDGTYDRPAHHDFWRISPDGLLFIRRGYPEDGGWKGIAPGTSFDITTSTWRLGEAILQGCYISEALGGKSANLILSASWTKLAGRVLVSHGNPNRYMSSTYRTHQDHYEVTQTIAVASLPDALPELVFSMLAPLYELFDFFRFPKRLVDEELASMRQNTFAH